MFIITNQLFQIDTNSKDYIFDDFYFCNPKTHHEILLAKQYFRNMIDRFDLFSSNIQQHIDSIRGFYFSNSNNESDIVEQLSSILVIVKPISELNDKNDQNIVPNEYIYNQLINKFHLVEFFMSMENHTIIEEYSTIIYPLIYFATHNRIIQQYMFSSMNRKFPYVIFTEYLSDFKKILHQLNYHNTIETQFLSEFLSEFFRNDLSINMRILNYFLVIEFLLTSKFDEKDFANSIGNQISVKSYIICNESGDKKKYTQMIKSAYNIRSSIVHGNWGKIDSELIKFTSLYEKYYNLPNNQTVSDLAGVSHYYSIQYFLYVLIKILLTEYLNNNERINRLKKQKVSYELNFNESCYV